MWNDPYSCAMGGLMFRLGKMDYIIAPFPALCRIDALSVWGDFVCSRIGEDPLFDNTTE